MNLLLEHSSEFRADLHWTSHHDWISLYLLHNIKWIKKRIYFYYFSLVKYSYWNQPIGKYSANNNEHIHTKTTPSRFTPPPPLNRTQRNWSRSVYFAMCGAHSSELVVDCVATTRRLCVADNKTHTLGKIHAIVGHLLYSIEYSIFIVHKAQTAHNQNRTDVVHAHDPFPRSPSAIDSITEQSPLDLFGAKAHHFYWT